MIMTRGKSTTMRMQMRQAAPNDAAIADNSVWSTTTRMVAAALTILALALLLQAALADGVAAATTSPTAAASTSVSPSASSSATTSATATEDRPFINYKALAIYLGVTVLLLGGMFMLQRFFEGQQQRGGK